MKQLVPGQEIEAEVIAVTDDCIFIDLNAKSEGIVDKADFTDKNGTCSVTAGQKIKVFFVGDKKGEMTFTAKISGEDANKDMLEQAWQQGIPVEGHVEKEIKGGFEVKVGTARAFCPYSQMGFRQKEAPAFYVGKNLTFRIQEYKEDGKNILLSNRVIEEETYQEHLSSIKDILAVGNTVTGTVESLQSYGAFVNVAGFKALLPISEISRGRVEDIASVLSPGQEITAQVISADWQRERVSLSLKNLTADPWDSVQEKYPVDSKHTGTISRVADFGLFVTLEPGIDGLVHISALENENRNTNLRVKYKTGTKMDVTVISLDPKQRRLGLCPTSSTEQDTSARIYLDNQDDSDTYNPFAALLKKK